MKKFLFGVFQFMLFAYVLGGNDAFGATHSEANQQLQQSTVDQNLAPSGLEFELLAKIQTLPEHHQTLNEVVFEDLQEEEEEEEEEDSSKKQIKSLFYEQIQFYFSFCPNRFQENKKFIFAVLPKHDSISTSRTILFQIFLI